MVEIITVILQGYMMKQEFDRLNATTCILLIIVLCLYGLPCLAWNQLPLLTESPRVLPVGQMQVGLGVQFLSHKNFYFSSFSQDFSRDVLSLPTFEVNVSLGTHAELQLTYEVLSVEEKELNIKEEWASGDVTFFTKVHVFSEQQYRPGIGIKLGAKLPNASEKRRVGTNETDVGFMVLAEKTVSGIRFRTHLGALILGDPSSKANQDDLLNYGIACSLSQGQQIRYGLEVAGQALGTEHNEQAIAIAHVSFKYEALTFYLSGRTGLLKNSEDWGVSGRVRWTLDVLGK